jgi:hypothetical protein
MVYFHTKNPNFWYVLEGLKWIMLVYLTAIWYILRSFGIFYDYLVYLRLFGIFYGHSIYFTVSWYILRPFMFIGIFFPVCAYCTKKYLKKNLANLHNIHDCGVLHRYDIIIGTYILHFKIFKIASKVFDLKFSTQ